MRHSLVLFLVLCGLLALARSVSAIHQPGRQGGRILAEKAMEKLVYIVTLEEKSVVATYTDVYKDDGSYGTKAQPIDQNARKRTDMRRKESDRYASRLKREQDALLAKNLQRGQYQTVNSFTHVMNAVTVEFNNEAQVEKIRNAPGVVYLERDYGLETTTTHSPQLLGLPSPTGAWQLAGGQDSAGENIVIGMVDTGIYPGHPSFADDGPIPYGPIPDSFRGGCVVDANSFPEGSCNKKLVGASFHGNSAMSYDILDPVLDFASPFDGNGHGTHTSAISAGNSDIEVIVEGLTYGSQSGIAPRARLSMYKCVFRFGGFTSDCVDAIDQAVQDGVQVISMSLGQSNPPDGVVYLSSLDLALLAAVKAGIVVVQSGGNAGSAAMTMSSFSPWIITVGATNTDRIYPVRVTLGNGKVANGHSYTGRLSSTQMISAADAINSNTQYDGIATGCQDSSALDGSLISGKILICFYNDDFLFGTASLDRVAWTAAALNASGFLFVVNDAFDYISSDPMPFGIPGAVLSDITNSQIVTSYYNSNPTTATAAIVIPANSTQYAEFGTISPVVAHYSSRGPVPSNAGLGETADVLKPDIVAPGTQIWSAWTQSGVDLPTWVSIFATLEGTSQAAPHVAGVAALIMQSHPTWSVAAVHSAIMTTATLLDSNNKEIQAQDDALRLTKATPFDMGAGFINPSAAINPGLIFDVVHQDYVNFICSVKGVNPSTVLSLINVPCNITSGSKPSDLNTPSITIAKLQGTRIVPRRVTNVGGVNETYTVSGLTTPASTQITITPMNFTIAPGATQDVKITIKATSSLKKFSYGRITWTGNRGHRVSIPVAVNPFSTS